MDAKDKVFIDNRIFRTLLKLKNFLAWTPGGDRPSKHKKARIQRDARLVRLQKKAARIRSYRSRRVNYKRAEGVN